MFHPNCKRAQVQGLKESRLTIRGDDNQGLSPLRRFGQVPSYSPRSLVSQSETLCERSVQGCGMAKNNTYSPLDYHWVILSTSKAFNYFRARRDEICCAVGVQNTKMFHTPLSVDGRYNSSVNSSFRKRLATETSIF